MPCHGYSTTAYACRRGSLLRNVKNSVCQDCYALKNRYVFPNVQAALNKRLYAVLNDPDWTELITELISRKEKSGYFRWHDSGDIQSLEHLQNIFRICRKTPDTKHWLPTREAQILKRVKVNEVPRNLVIRFSSHMIDQAPVNFWPWTSTVTTDGNHSCPAATQNNECKDCRQCWSRDVKNVSYGKH